MQNKLLPCPFCNGEARLNYFESKSQIPFYQIVCGECGCKQVPSIHREAALNAWNTRKPMESIVEQLEKEIGKCFVGTWEDYDEYEDGRANGFERAIEIVKGGAE